MLLTGAVAFAIVPEMIVTDHIQVLLQAGWSQARIARESGIKQPCISRLVNGTQTDVHYRQGKRLEVLAAESAAGDTAQPEERMVS